MKRDKHSLSNYKLLSMNMGPITPIGIQEVLPGDTFKAATSALIRVSPLLAPVMHPVHVMIHHWFVPTRIIWEDFQDFITGGPDGMNESVPPYRSVGAEESYDVGSLSDYFGIKPGVGSFQHSILPHRAYSLIYNEFYRDQDLVDPLPISTASGQDTTTNVDLVNVAWEKDYFTLARPWTQKGPAITVPLAGTADVTLKPFGSPPIDPIGTQKIVDNVTGAGQNSAAANQGLFASTYTGSGVENQVGTFLNATNSGNSPSLLDPNGTMQVDFSEISSIDVNDLREMFALQRYEEARARYGSRFTEYLRYLGVRSSDARLQRPEYLGGGKQTIQFSEVLQTAPGDGSSVGDLKGHGIAAMRSNRFQRFFEEHGYMITVMSVRPKTIYGDGLHRMWSRETKEDYWQRELQHIGQQEIKNKEVDLTSSTPEETWGYIDRYKEYKECPSTIAGEFRTSLNFWHMARQFASPPELNGDFVTANPTNRIYASTATQQLWVMANHSVKARRLVSGNNASFIK